MFVLNLNIIKKKRRKHLRFISTLTGIVWELKKFNFLFLIPPICLIVSHFIFFQHVCAVAKFNVPFNSYRSGRKNPPPVVKLSSTGVRSFFLPSTLMLMNSIWKETPQPQLVTEYAENEQTERDVPP